MHHIDSKTTLYKGDCLKVLSLVEDESVDMILCDLPYGVTKLSWDVQIPFKPMWEQLHRVIKKDGAMVFTATQPFASQLINSNLKNFKYEWIWHKNKTTDFVRAKIKPLAAHENILVFSLSDCATGAKNMRYYPQGLKPYNKTIKNDNIIFGREVSKLRGMSYYQEHTNYPTTQLNFDCELTTVHPTQKPIELMSYLIRTYTRKGDTILDFTMGSGSTGVAAMRTQRAFIGIELEQKYFDIAISRMEAEKQTVYYLLEV